MPDAQLPEQSTPTLAQWQIVAAIADLVLWPCRRHLPDGCENKLGDGCIACRMVDALHEVGLGDGLEKGADRES